MKIFICTMEDPVYTIPFIKNILLKRKNDIVGFAVSRGNRLTIGKKRSKLAYLFSLLLILGPVHYFKYLFINLSFKVRYICADKLSLGKSPSLLRFAEELGIKTFKVKTVNSKKFLAELKKLNPDVIINQTQNILKKSFLEIPKIGVINRHNALLPKNRGRLTPFWVLYKNEKETGVSIHFVTEDIDGGDIIVQEKYEVVPEDTFNTIAKKNYEIAPLAMFKALDLLENGKYQLIRNNDHEASYNTIPTVKQAFKYRLSRIS